MISHTHKCIFIHNNKTGGTSISKFLINDPEPECKHCTILEHKEKYGDCFDSYFKFTIVRNPWDRLVSQYFFRVGDDSQFGFVPRKKNTSFREFLQRPFPIGHVQQFSRISNKNGNVLVDFIGKFENLQQDSNVVCDKLGIPQQQLPHEYKTKHKHYTEYYDDETKEIVAERYTKDIEYFGYEFGQ